MLVIDYTLVLWKLNFRYKCFFATFHLLWILSKKYEIILCSIIIINYRDFSEDIKVNPYGFVQDGFNVDLFF